MRMHLYANGLENGEVSLDVLDLVSPPESAH